jgi:hypothetical protein
MIHLRWYNYISNPYILAELKFDNIQVSPKLTKRVPLQTKITPKITPKRNPSFELIGHRSR